MAENEDELYDEYDELSEMEMAEAQETLEGVSKMFQDFYALCQKGII